MFWSLIIFLSISQAAEIHDAMMMSIRKGRIRGTVQNICRNLEQNPDDAELLVLLGVAWERSGLYADADGVYQLVASGDYYEQHGIDSHANTLRELGDSSTATALRRERLLDAGLSEGREVRTLIAMTDDYLAIGDTAGAKDAALRALAIYPKAPQVQAVLAHVALEEGDVEEADYRLFTSFQFGPTARGAVVGAMKSVREGDLVKADRYLEEAKVLQAPTIQLSAWRAEVARLMGEPMKAKQLLKQSRWILTEDPWMMAVRIRVAADTSDYAWAQETADRANLLYPNNRDVRRSMAYFSDSALAP